MDDTVRTRIPPTAFQASTGVLLGVAIFAYLCRLWIQFLKRSKFGAEDWVLLFAVVMLIGNTTLCYLLFPRLYRTLQVTLGTINSEILFEVLNEIPTESAEADAIAMLWWFTIYPVKLAYLLFFRKLISRLKRLTRYWWFVTGFMVAGMIASVVADWFVCPYFETGELIAKCAGNAEGIRALKATIVTTVFDVLSDIFIASIPICLLWQVRLRLQQKIGLGMTLCLSLVMVVIAFVRIAGMHLGGDAMDIVWLAFWMQNECNIAVWMVSMTTFRSLFVTGEGEPGRLAWVGRMRMGFRRKLSKLFRGKFTSGEEETNYGPYGETPSDRSNRPMIQSHEPAIPAATITGMRTAIGRVGDAQDT